ncbi:MAG: hypothetical protein K9H49_01005 [Bacteroidales bacterium]|nr:hypothetical protein [Bacteroidales bacterium]MCF8390056.1 hypothetical protein [Bacteroidales bacterium]
MSIIVILAQTKTGAWIEIIAFLLVAAIIGFLTAYFYYKSVYTREINFLKEDVAKLSGEVRMLKDEIHSLEEKLDEKDKEIANLKKKK